MDPHDREVAGGWGAGKLITASIDCIEVTRKNINRKKTISTIAVISMRSLCCVRRGINSKGYEMVTQITLKNES